MTEVENTEGVFRSLIGRDGAKVLLRSALRRGDVHILLEGPPASGKSVTLTDIERAVEDCLYTDAAGFTERELRDTFSHDPDVLLLDEIDAMQSGAYEAMSMPMEDGRVTKNTNHETYDVEVDTQVVATCNDASDLPAHTADRFRIIEFDPYTVEEYLDVCAVILVDEVEWVGDEETAREIAERVHEAVGTTSPRDARDAAKLAGGPGNVETIAEAMDDPDADVDSDPLHPDDTAHARVDDAQEILDVARASSVDGSKIKRLRSLLPGMTKSLTNEELGTIVGTWERLFGDVDVEPGDADPSEDNGGATSIDLPDQQDDTGGGSTSGGGGGGGVEIQERPIHEAAGELPEDEEPTNSISTGLRIHHTEDAHEDVHEAIANAMGVHPENFWDGSQESGEPGFDLYYRFDIKRSSPGNAWSSGKVDTDELLGELGSTGADILVVSQGSPFP